MHVIEKLTIATFRDLLLWRWIFMWLGSFHGCWGLKGGRARDHAAVPDLPHGDDGLLDLLGQVGHGGRPGIDILPLCSLRLDVLPGRG